MSTSVSWPVIGGTTYSIPAAGELNWQALSTFLIAIGNAAQSTANTKLSIRSALTTPVTVASATDTVVITKLTSPAAVTVNLPAGILGQAYFIVDGTGDASSNNVTIDPNGAETINGTATYVINKDRAGVLIGFNGTSWTILAEYTNIAAGTIPRSSIALGSANQVVINSGTGALSSEAQLAKSRGGTGADNSSVTFPSTGTIVTEAGSAVLTGKTIDGDDNTVQDLGITTLKTVIGNATKFLSFDGSGAPVASKAVPTGTVVGTSDAQVITLKDIDGGTATNTSRFTVPSAAIATLTALTRKEGTIVYGTDTDLLYTDNGVTLSALTPATTATPTAQGLVTSYFPTIQSSVKTVGTGDYTSNIYTVNTTDGYEDIIATTSSTNRTIALPAAASNAGRVLMIKKADSGTGKLVVDPNSSELIDGVATCTLWLINEAMTIVCDGTGWQIRNYEVNSFQQYFTPTSPNSSLGTITVNPTSSYFQRVGRSSLLMQLRFSCGTVSNVETQLAIPNSWTLGTMDGSIPHGNWFIANATTNSIKRGVVIGNSGNPAYVRFTIDEYEIALSPYTAQPAGTAGFSNTVLAGMNAIIPIAEFLL